MGNNKYALLFCIIQVLVYRDYNMNEIIIIKKTNTLKNSTPSQFFEKARDIYRKKKREVGLIHVFLLSDHFYVL